MDGGTNLQACNEALKLVLEFGQSLNLEQVIGISMFQGSCIAHKLPHSSYNATRIVQGDDFLFVGGDKISILDTKRPVSACLYT